MIQVLSYKRHPHKFSQFVPVLNACKIMDEALQLADFLFPHKYQRNYNIAQSCAEKSCVMVVFCKILHRC